MRIVICAVGTRGDIQPTVALAEGLQRAGHDVLLFTHEMYADLARTHGIAFRGLPGDPTQGLIQTAAADLGNNPVRLARWLRKNFQPNMRDLFVHTLDAVSGCDLIIGASVSLAAFHVAEKLGVPAISVQYQPSIPTRHHPGALIPPSPAWLPLHGLYNRVATKLGNQAIFQMLRPLSNRCRREILDLPPLSMRYWWDVDSPDNDVPMLFGYSETVLQQPSDWGPLKRVTGYYFLDREPGWRPPAELAAFLDRGPPPVYVGVGCVVDHAPRETTRIVLEAMSLCGRRVILQAGWSRLGVEEVPDSVCVVDDVPHDWLFPRLAAVVHHGGAGTTAAALRAGLPSVVVPFYADQFLWSRRVHALGCGPPAIPRKRLTVATLTSALDRALGDAEIGTRAAEVGTRLRSEDGVGRAVALIERFGK